MEVTNNNLEPHLQRLVNAGCTGIDIMHGELKLQMLEADTQYLEAQKIEEDNDYSDAMESMDRKYWEGYTDALALCYKMTYDISFAIGERETNNA